MKKQSIYLLLLFSTTLLGLVGCSKDASFKDSDKLPTQDREKCSGSFSPEEVSSIGSLHNSVIVNVFDGFDFDALDRMSEAKDQFAAAYPNLTASQIDEYFTLGTAGFDITAHYNEINNTTLVSSYYASIVYALDYCTSITSLESSLRSVENSANANLDCSDRDFILVCITVAQNSAKLWAPTNMGGDGYFDTIQELKGLSGIAGNRWTWRDVAKGDLIGAAAVFFEFGLGLAVPGTNAAVATAIGYGAAAGSIGAML